MVKIFCIVVLFSFPSFAGRSLKEAKNIRKISKNYSKSQLRSILKKKDLSDECPISVLNKSSMLGTRCRLAIFEESVHRQKLRHKRNLKKLVKLGKSSLDTAKSLIKYTPINKVPNFERLKLQAHRSSCASVLEIASKLEKESSRLRKKDAALARLELKGNKNKKGMFLLGCECARDTISLSSMVRDITVAEQGELQSVLISQGCFLDKEKMAQKRGGPESSFSGKANKVAESRSQNSLFLAYAKTRDVGLTRCKKIAEDGLNKKKKAKVKRCICNEMKRWRFPKERGRKDVQLKLPIIDDRLMINAVVSQVGKVSTCGDLSGELVKGLD